MLDRYADQGPCTYTVVRDGDELLVTCSVCGTTRLTRAAAEKLLDPVMGLEGPMGRFQTKATAGERARLVALIRSELVKLRDLVRGELARWPS